MHDQVLIINKIIIDNSIDDGENLPTEIAARDETTVNSDNDEAEPSLMVDSALSGGSTKTSAPLLSLNCRSTSYASLEEPSLSSPSTADDESIPAFDFDNWLNSFEDLKFAEEESYDSRIDGIDALNRECDQMPERSSLVG